MKSRGADLANFLADQVETAQHLARAVIMVTDERYEADPATRKTVYFPSASLETKTT